MPYALVTDQADRALSNHTMPTRSKRLEERSSGKQPAAPWKRANPKPKAARQKLSAAAKGAARARAEEAGRPYPNLIDNMWAARASARSSKQ